MHSIVKTIAVSGFGLVAGVAFANASVSADTTKVVVESGDTLNQIAKDYNTTVNSLAENNHIKNINLIYVGDVLVVTPVSDNTISVPAEKVTEVSTPVQPPAKVETPVTSQPVSSSSSKGLLVNRESGGSYTAQNGRYYGKYQLDISYLHGDLSPQNQDRVAEQYVSNRYGSWDNAWAHSQATGWY